MSVLPTCTCATLAGTAYPNPDCPRHGNVRGGPLQYPFPKPVQPLPPAPEVDPGGKSPHEAGAKLDAGKTRVWLMLRGFARALDEVAKITTAGAIKYTPDGWESVENGSARYMDAFGRHMVDVGKGKVFDDGSKGTGQRHKAQMIWNLLASLELDLRAEEKSK